MAKITAVVCKQDCILI